MAKAAAAEAKEELKLSDFLQHFPVNHQGSADTFIRCSTASRPYVDPGGVPAYRIKGVQALLKDVQDSRLKGERINDWLPMYYDWKAKSVHAHYNKVDWQTKWLKPVHITWYPIPTLSAFREVLRAYRPIPRAETDTKKIYWDENGKYQADFYLLHCMLPPHQEMPCATDELRLLRVMINVYHGLHRGGMINFDCHEKRMRKQLELYREKILATKEASEEDLRRILALKAGEIDRNDLCEDEFERVMNACVLIVIESFSQR